MVLKELESKRFKYIRIELAGIYAVASRLCSEGYLAIPVPSGHFPEIDVIVQDIEKKKYTGIQVKSLGSDKPKYYFPPKYPHPTIFVKGIEKGPLEVYVHDLSSINEIIKEMESRPIRRRFIIKDRVEIPEKREKWDDIFKS
ncbi:MAG: hypothetical protein V1915_03780 [Candidatus Bathyarchaeota archaeon]